MAGILVETSGTIATLTIENAGKRNSLTAEMWLRLPEALSELASDPGVKVLVVRGAGEDFSSGADIRDLARILHAPGMPDGGLVTAAENALAVFPKPTVAAIDGFCVGGGWQIAAACDVRIASDRATFGITPARIGIIYPLSGIQRLVSIVGLASAKYLLFSGEFISSGHAVSLGMLAQVHPASGLWAAVESFAAMLASRSQLSIQAMKQLVHAFAAGTDAAAIGDAWQREAAASDDAGIGAAAFLAHEPPTFSWTGSGFVRRPVV